MREPQSVSSDQQMLREARWLLAIWGAFVLWVLFYTFMYVRPMDPRAMGATFGLPTWIVMGILLPWILSTMVTFWFCLCVMEDRDEPEQTYEQQ